MSGAPHLTRAELRDLVERDHKGPIIAWLKEKRWRFTLDADGWPKVARAYYERRLGIVDQPVPETEAEPDFTTFRLRRVS